MIVADALRQAVHSLQAQGIPDALLEGELILAYSLGWDRVRLYSHGEEHVPTDREKMFAWHLERRLRREPLPYILKSREFYGLDFYVDKRVLIPRQETEHLVEGALAFATKLAPPEGRLLRIADIGTGSGAIAVSLAVNLPEALIYATDISSDALEVASINAERHMVSSRITFLRGDLLEPLSTPVDILIANLPYIPERVLSYLQPEVSLGEPSQAFFGGKAGTEVIARLLSQVQGRICRPGLILLEIGDEQGVSLTNLAKSYLPGADITVVHDLAGLDRVIRVEVP